MRMGDRQTDSFLFLFPHPTSDSSFFYPFYCFHFSSFWMSTNSFLICRLCNTWALSLFLRKTGGWQKSAEKDERRGRKTRIVVSEVSQTQFLHHSWSTSSWCPLFTQYIILCILKFLFSQEFRLVYDSRLWWSCDGNKSHLTQEAVEHVALVTLREWGIVCSEELSPFFGCKFSLNFSLHLLTWLMIENRMRKRWSWHKKHSLLKNPYCGLETWFRWSSLSFPLSLSLPAATDKSWSSMISGAKSTFCC